MPGRALVVLPNTTVVPEYEADLVICADSGFEVALGAGLKVDVLIGDMDSIKPQILDQARRCGAKVIEYPSDKDCSDGELAVMEAKRQGARELLILGGRLGRVDHFISSLLLPLLLEEEITVTCMIDDEVCMLLRKGQERELSKEFVLFSLIPLGSGCRVSVSGAKWELDDMLLPMGTTRGIHNEVIGKGARVACCSGMVLLVLSNRD